MVIIVGVDGMSSSLLEFVRVDSNMSLPDSGKFLKSEVDIRAASDYPHAEADGAQVLFFGSRYAYGVRTETSYYP